MTQLRYDVAVLEDDDDLRQSLVDIFEARNLGRCLPLRSFADLLARGEDALPCRAIIIDINLGAGVPTGLDAHHWLRANDFKGKEVFLTGHAFTDSAVAEAIKLESVNVLAKPATLDAIVALLGPMPK